MINQRSTAKTNIKRKIIKPLLVIFITLLVLLNIWIGLSKAGLIPNYLRLKIFRPWIIFTKGCTNSPYTLPEDMVACKPVIYLYPKQEQQIEVRLNYSGNLLFTYPEYKNGWQVIASPDGKIINKADNKEYSYLFWEGKDEYTTYDLSHGFIVKGSETVNFLQDKLSQIGLIPKEYNEFIVYWLPKMQNNKYNLIHFASKEEYNDRALLNITPKPESTLRVFMVFKKLENNNIKIQPQEIIPFERKGFVVIEWGGTEIFEY
jgi:hypothetical protein